jgi:hypothetical protein
VWVSKPWYFFKLFEVSISGCLDDVIHHPAYAS